MTPYNNPPLGVLLADAATQDKLKIEVQLLVLEHVVNIAAIVEITLCTWLRITAQLRNNFFATTQPSFQKNSMPRTYLGVIGLFCSMIFRNHQNIADLALSQMEVPSSYNEKNTS